MRHKKSVGRGLIFGTVFLFSLLCPGMLTAVHAGPGQTGTYQTDSNLPLPAPELMKLLENGEFEILSDEETGYSTQHSRKLKLSFRNVPRTINVKWKVAPKTDGEKWNNSPRREVAAYVIQQLFLDPQDYVVPPTSIRCIPLAQYKKVEPYAEPNIPPFQCVYGAFAAWLTNVEVPENVFDEQRFAKDKLFAYHMANMNLLDYLINHQDGVISNYLYSTDPAHPRVFSIDNGLSMGWQIHNPFVTQWKKIRVPALPRQSIERLRKVTEDDLNRLGVLQQMDVDANGVLQNVEPGKNIDPKLGSRISSKTIQIGLKPAEIKKVQRKIQKLLDEVDHGKWEIF